MCIEIGFIIIWCGMLYFGFDKLGFKHIRTAKSTFAQRSALVNIRSFLVRTRNEPKKPPNGDPSESHPSSAF